MSEKELKRNWSKYNEHLVQRGEILLDCLQGWQQELLRMNRGKNGRPCGYPHRLILFLGTLRVVFHLKVLGDSGYDSHENLEFLAASGIEAALQVRENANPNCGERRWCG